MFRVALEQRDAGEPLDDLIVDARAADGSAARLSLQVKREVTISAAKTNKDFRSIVRDSWATVDRPAFRVGIDRVGAAVGPSTAVGKWRDLVALAEFATASATPIDFAARFAPKGSASKEHRAVLKDLQTITADLGRPASTDDMYALLRHFVLIRIDELHEGATDEAATVALLETALASGHGGQTSRRAIGSGCDSTGPAGATDDFGGEVIDRHGEITSTPDQATSARRISALSKHFMIFETGSSHLVALYLR